MAQGKMTKSGMLGKPSRIEVPADEKLVLECLQAMQVDDARFLVEKARKSGRSVVLTVYPGALTTVRALARFARGS